MRFIARISKAIGNIWSINERASNNLFENKKQTKKNKKKKRNRRTFGRKSKNCSNVNQFGTPKHQKDLIPSKVNKYYTKHYTFLNTGKNKYLHI